MRKRLTQFLFWQILIHRLTECFKVDAVGNGHHDKWNDVAVRLEQEACLVMVFGNRICIEAVIGVEEVACADAVFGDFDMHHLGASCGEEYECGGRDDGECDEQKIVYQKFYGDERPRNEDDRCIPVIGLLRIKMFECFPFHNVTS